MNEWLGNNRLGRSRLLIGAGEGIRTPLVPVIGWMNTGSLSACEGLSSDNYFSARFTAYLTPNYLTALDRN